MRERLLSELEKSRNNLKNSLEYVHEKDNKKGSKIVRKVLDEIDVFSNEIDLSETGHHYPFFDPKESIKKDDLKEIAKFDKDMLETCRDVTEATEEIQQNMIDGQDMDIEKEFNSLRQYITNIRNTYKDRLNHIKKIEPAESD